MFACCSDGPAVTLSSEDHASMIVLTLLTTNRMFLLFLYDTLIFSGCFIFWLCVIYSHHCSLWWIWAQEYRWIRRSREHFWTPGAQTIFSHPCGYWELKCKVLSHLSSPWLRISGRWETECHLVFIDWSRKRSLLRLSTLCYETNTWVFFFHFIVAKSKVQERYNFLKASWLFQ